MSVADPRSPPSPSPPDPPEIRPSGGRPRRFSNCAWFLARTRARVGSSFGAGGRAGGETTAGVSIRAGLAFGTGGGADGETTADGTAGAGLASWYSHALSAIPQLVKTSKSAIARGQCFPQSVAMRPPYRHGGWIRPAGVGSTLNWHASKQQHRPGYSWPSSFFAFSYFPAAAGGLGVPDAPSAPDRNCLRCLPVSQPEQRHFREWPRSIRPLCRPRSG
jgi:hypothetical protein